MTKVYEPLGGLGLAAATAREPLPSMRILVAEDDETNQTVIIRMLSKLGMEVVLAIDGYQAVERAVEQSFDVILMDSLMPGMSGTEAARSMRARGVTQPIIAYTASAMENDVEHYLEAGMTDVLPKPAKLAALASILAKYGPR